MLAGARVLGRMAIRRGIAAEGRAARLAGAQMDPLGAYLHALLAGSSLRVFDGLYGIDVCAGAGHDILPLDDDVILISAP
jgi:hypothetical protein